MNTKYSKSQICEAIRYWKSQLKLMSEAKHYSAEQNITYEFYKGSEIAGKLSKDDIVKLTALRYGLYKKEQARWNATGVDLDPSEVKSTSATIEYFSECTAIALARADGTIIGFGTGTQDRYQEMLPDNIYLDEGALNPTYIGTGIEAELAKQLLDYCRKNGYSTFITSVDVNNPDNDKNMRSVGFVPWQMDYICH